MRIQHNIPAMNAYRNYNANTKALQGNLQKLSSGYKINKAGDDAAGLAISEKMRAQITGLEVAQKNAKDGISLVQTAEGALQEVHTMLNRMYSLAEQSANGTYADEVDREQLQKEVVSLRDEIDRIADASNFNGKKLLDGSLAGAGKSGAANTSLKTTTVDATAGQAMMTVSSAVTTSTTAKSTVHLSMAFGDTVKDYELTFDPNAKTLTDKNGNQLTTTITNSNSITATEMTAVMKELLSADKDISNAFKIEANGANLTLTNKTAGGSEMQLTGVRLWSLSGGAATAADTSVTFAATMGTDEFQAVDLNDATNIPVWDGTEKTLEDSIFEVNGEKFLFADTALKAGLSDDQKQWLKEAGVGNNYVALSTGTTVATADANAMATKIAVATGADAVTGTLSAAGVWTGTTNGTMIGLKGVSSGSNGGGLTLQIGDTSDSYNKMTVSVNDMHAKAMGIGSIDIGTEDGASAAMKSIKDAINYVSDTRGTLGALQNRLDHTINNLSVQQENIQDAESTIRDVDVANEMMAYTKNNILVQSAQAMLAQANQLPQGVLQLLG